MGLLLCIETATSICSVALGKDGVLLSLQEAHETNQHSSQLTLLISKLFEDSGTSLHDLDAIAVSKGPGSYTGLRIGVSTAKGLCYGLEKPMIGLSTLQAMAYGMSVQCEVPEGSLFCPMIDARRMEVYMALYDATNETIHQPVAEIIDINTFAAFQQKHTIVCAGDGAEKCKATFEGMSGILFPQAAVPSAQFMIPLAERAFQMSQFENVAYFEPYYLKDFIAGKAVVKGL